MNEEDKIAAEKMADDMVEEFGKEDALAIINGFLGIGDNES